MVFGLFRVCWEMSKTVVELLACWQWHFGHHRNGRIWLATPHYLMWCIWRETNNQCFEDSERSLLDLKLFFFRICWIGCKFCVVILYSDLIDLCNLSD